MDLGLSFTRIPRIELKQSAELSLYPLSHFTSLNFHSYKTRPGVVAHTYSLALREAEAGGFQVEANLGYITTKSDCSRQSEC